MRAGLTCNEDVAWARTARPFSRRRRFSGYPSCVPPDWRGSPLLPWPDSGISRPASAAWRVSADRPSRRGPAATPCILPSRYRRR